jgi:hypothetical protein
MKGEYKMFVKTIMDTSDLGILADSGSPTKIGEYFSARKPVVATKVGDLQHYFSDKKRAGFRRAKQSGFNI